MRLSVFLVVIVAALAFLIPQMHRNQNQDMFARQAQEEAPMEEIEDAPHTYKITYEVTNPRQEPLADIIWMKKAAEVARDAGIPYFNVLRQVISKRFVRQHDRQLSVVEGVIQLDNDPMRAEYDANEIESLVLTEYP